jgi:predicted metal-binding membrane protein
MNTASAEVAREQQGGDAAFLAVMTLIFCIAATLTIHGSVAMPMMWMRMPGQTWPAVAAGFLGMWVAMMVAMMLPSLMPMLWRYRRTLRATNANRVGLLTAVVAIAYFCVWSAFGLAVFPVGVALSAMQTRLPTLARAAPAALGVLLVVAGVLQFTAWKSHHLACCRRGPGHGGVLAARLSTAWRHGLRCGVHCSFCCAGPTLVLLACGAMDLRSMTTVMLVVTAERLAPAAERVARAIGSVAVAAGFALMMIR